MLSRLREWHGRRRHLTCSFCRRSEHEVTNLVAGADAYICDECIDKCSAIIAAQRGGTP